MELKMGVGEGFELEKAICNHGFFMMSPNQWIPSTKSFQRPLRLADRSSSVTVSITQPPLCNNSIHDNHILVHVHGVQALSDDDQQVILEQVGRMLRISSKDEDDVRNFQKIHAEAQRKGFGRLFRSPHLFEDITKSILLCNVSWNRTLQMCQALCELQAELHSGNHIDIPAQVCKKSSANKKINFKNKKKFLPTKRKSSETPKPQPHYLPTKKNVNVKPKPLGNFPTSKELAGLTKEFLKDHCRLGYRAKYIIQLAKLVESGELKLKEFEGHQVFDNESYMNIYDKLMELKGIGSFAAANIFMCIGDYHTIPIDTETIKLLQEVHGIKGCKKATVEEDASRVYDRFAPYQCLAYWYELIELYEEKLGQALSELPPSSYHKASSSACKIMPCDVQEKRKEKEDVEGSIGNKENDGELTIQRERI